MLYLIYALSFYRFQNVLGSHKYFVKEKKDDLQSVKLVLVPPTTNFFEEALNVFKFLGCHKIFGPVQNIFGPAKGPDKASDSEDPHPLDPFLLNLGWVLAIRVAPITKEGDGMDEVGWGTVC